MTELKENPTLKDIQEYILKWKKLKKFNTTDPIYECFMLIEEVGELTKAIRKSHGNTIDPKSHVGGIGEEISDCIFFLFNIANIYNIDIETEFRKKDEINRKRHWDKIKKEPK